MAKRVLAQRFGGLANFAFAGQEHQHIPRPFAAQFIAGIDNGIVKIALIVLLGFFGLHRTITHLDRKHAS